MSDSAARLSMALAADLSAIGFPGAELELMPGTGVSHNHYRITGTDWISESRTPQPIWDGSGRAARHSSSGV